MPPRKREPLGVATLEDIGRLILHSHDLDETLRNVADLVARRAGTDVCSIYLLAEDGRTLVLRASHGLAKKAVGKVQMTLDEGLTGLVAREKRIVAVREPQEHPLYRHFKETGEERFHSFFGVPLLDRSEPVGVLVLQTREPRDFTVEETSALSSIAYQVAAIVVNARLLDTVRRTEDASRRYAGELERLRRGGGPAGEEGRGEGIEQLLRGSGTSPGFAVGRANLMDEQQHPIEMAVAAPADPTGESARLEKALEETRVQTILLEKQVAGRLAEAEAGIFHTHLMVLEDRGFLDKLHREVARGHGSATAVKMAVAEYLEAFGRMEDPYLRERAADIRDIGRRILAHLAGRGTPDPALAAEGILVAAELLPSDMAALDPARVRGIVTERGEATSHAAIMARSLGIPALMGVKGALRAISPGDRLILDANSGVVYINPGELVAAEYRRLEVERRREGDLLEGLRDRPALSLDGVRVTLRANIGLISDVDVALRNGADGVGLYRSEFPYMVREDFPDREDQYRLYRHVVERFGGAPITIRTLDVGGDKHLPYAVQAHEENPFMGLALGALHAREPRDLPHADRGDPDGRRARAGADPLPADHQPRRGAPLQGDGGAGAREPDARGGGVRAGRSAGYHDRGAGGGLAGAGVRRRGGFLLGGDERPRAVSAGRRPHEPARAAATTTTCTRRCSPRCATWPRRRAAKNAACRSAAKWPRIRGRSCCSSGSATASSRSRPPSSRG